MTVIITLFVPMNLRPQRRQLWAKRKNQTSALRREKEQRLMDIIGGTNKITTYPGGLHNHTDYSNLRLRDSITKTEELIWHAAELGH